MPKIRPLATALALCTAVLVLPSPSQAEDSQARELTPFTVMLDWFINPDHAPLVVALEQGYFEEAGLAVEMVEPGDPNDPPRLVAAGRADLAISYQPQFHLQIDAGLPLIRVGTLVATPLNTLMTLEGGPIETLADLEGRRVGFAVAGTTEATLAGMLETVGLTLDDIELINIGFAISPALLSRQVDAAIGAYRNFEMTQLELEGAQGRPFFPEEHGVPAYDELIFLAQDERARDPEIRAFLDAVERGVMYLVNHPEESWEAYARRYPQSDDELNRRAWDDTLPRFALRPSALDSARYARFADFLHAGGLIDAPPPVETYAIVPE